MKIKKTNLQSLENGLHMNSYRLHELATVRIASKPAGSENSGKQQEADAPGVCAMGKVIPPLTIS